MCQPWPTPATRPTAQTSLIEAYPQTSRRPPPPQSVVAAAHAAAQAAAGVASSDTPQSVTSELSAGSPASATAGTLSGGELTADSQQRSLADDATPAEASETS